MTGVGPTAARIRCAPMTAATRDAARDLLAGFLGGDPHYLASAASYGDAGTEALPRALDLFLARPELGFVWLAGLLFRRTTAKVFFVIAAGMASGSWNQIIFNLRYVAPVPWMIGLLLLAFRRQSRVLLFVRKCPEL